LTFTDQTWDGSGYTLTATLTPTGRFSRTLWDKSGNKLDTSGLFISDPDGNTLSYSTSVSGGIITTTYTDTLGQVVLKTTETSTYPHTETYTYTDKNGGNQTYTVAYTQMTVQTNFSSQCGNRGPGTSYLATTITESPSGEQYTLSYEPTPGFPGDVTGRIQQITFPSGGYVKYTYSGGVNGLDCSASSGFIPVITKTVSDNNGHQDVWTYTNNFSNRTPPNSANYTVVETNPAGNQTVYTFYTSFQTKKQVYQGPVSANNLLSTTINCYNANFSYCWLGGSPGLPVTQTDVYTYLGNSSSASLVETKYNHTGTIAEIKRYDFGAATTLPPNAAPTTSPISDTTFTYDGNGASCGTLATNSNINDRPCSVTTKNASGTIVSQVNYTYNSTGHPIQNSTLVSGTT